SAEPRPHGTKLLLRASLPGNDAPFPIDGVPILMPIALRAAAFLALTLTAGQAAAADLPRRMVPPPEPAPTIERPQAVPATPALATGRLELTFRNTTSTAVNVRLRALNSSATWPVGGRFYIIDAIPDQTISLSCYTGTPICYGAWASDDRSVSWGVGLDGRVTCRGCCYACAVSPPATTVFRR